MNQAKRKRLPSSALTGRKPLARERTRQSPSPIPILRGRGSKLNPAVTIVTLWREVEPTVALKRLLCCLLSRPLGGEV